MKRSRIEWVGASGAGQADNAAEDSMGPDSTNQLAVNFHDLGPGELDDRAQDLLDRLMDLGIDAGLTESDLYGTETREPLRALCKNLADRVEKCAPLFEHSDVGALLQAIRRLRETAGSSGNAAQGRLDSALKNLADQIDPDSPSLPFRRQRIEWLEALTAYVQCGHMIARQREMDSESKMDTGDASLSPPLSPPDFKRALQCSAQIRSLLKMLQIPESSPPPPALEVMEAIRGALQGTMEKLPPSVFLPLVPSGSLDPSQTALLSEIDGALRREYAVRRKVLVERVLVTLQSFAVSPKVQSDPELKKEVQQSIQEGTSRLQVEPSVSLSDVHTVTLADLMDVAAKATSGDRTFKSSMKAVIIGAVPDRGGRTEGKHGAGGNMPQWKARSEATNDGPSGGGRGGGHGGGRGGRGGDHKGKK